jgi:hypothetical protein
VGLDDTDRRRFIVVSVLTVLLLPALWLIAREDGSGAPDLATAGADIDADLGSDTTADPAARSALSLDPPLSDTPPVFLGGPSGAPGAGLAEVAVPTDTGARSQATAT